MDNQINSIVKLAQKLIEIPSQAEIDSCDPILFFLKNWLQDKDLKSTLLVNDLQENLGLLITIPGNQAQETYCLNACIDTAPFGNLATWEMPPNSGALVDGWLYGRGSADSKIAVAIFSHIALLLKDKQKDLKTNIHFLFDADEHTRRFGGIKTYLNAHPNVDGFMIGYPGDKNINVGARGFYRIQLIVFGKSAHSGSSQPVSENAIEKAIYLGQKLIELELPSEINTFFAQNPKLTVTRINGGNSYSIVPDLCSLDVDIRDLQINRLPIPKRKCTEVS